MVIVEVGPGMLTKGSSMASLPNQQKFPGVDFTQIQYSSPFVGQLVLGVNKNLRLVNKDDKLGRVLNSS